MQIALHSDYHTLAHEESSGSTTVSQVPFRERQERRIMNEYLPNIDGERGLNVACGNSRFQDYFTDHTDLSHALATAVADDCQCNSQSLPQSLRTSFAPNTFSTVVCFRLDECLTAEDLEDLLWEAGRVCSTGARLIIEVPSAERRRISSRWSAQLNARFAHTAAVVEECRGTRWREVAVVGVNLLPVDRLPKWLHGVADALNHRLCRTPLRKYARSRAYVLELL